MGRDGWPEGWGGLAVASGSLQGDDGGRRELEERRLLEGGTKDGGDLQQGWDRF